MANRIRTGDPRGFNKGRSSKFHEGYRVWQTPEEGQKTYQPKRCGNNNKDEDSSSKTLNDKNQQALSQKFRQPLWICFALLFEKIVSLLCFPFLSHVQVFLSEISLVCHLKYPYSCFSSHFCFLVIFVLLMLVLSVFFLVAVK